MASQGSEQMTDSQADRELGIDNGDSQDAGVMPPPISKEPTPDWLDKKNHPALANPLAGSAGGATGPMPQPKLALQPSVGTAMAQKMSNVSVAAPAAAPAPSAGSASSGPVQRPAASKATANSDDSDTDEEEEVDTRTDEQKQQDKIANAISTEIARVESSGYKFKESTRWAAVAAYLDDKDLFDDKGLDITCCAVGDKKKITLNSVTGKIKELRAAAAEKRQQMALQPLEHGESQFGFSDSEEEKEEEVLDDDEDITGFSEQKLNARISEMKTELAIKKKRMLPNSGPVQTVLHNYKVALKSFKGATYEKYKMESKAIKTFCTEDLREKEFSVYQYQMLSEIAAAEVVKAGLPKEVQDLDKQLKNYEQERDSRTASRAFDNAANAVARRKKREDREAEAAVASSTPTSAAKRLKGGK